MNKWINVLSIAKSYCSFSNLGSILVPFFGFAFRPRFIFWMYVSSMFHFLDLRSIHVPFVESRFHPRSIFGICIAFVFYLTVGKWYLIADTLIKIHGGDPKCMVGNPHTWWGAHINGVLAGWLARPPCLWAPHHVCGFPTMHLGSPPCILITGITYQVSDGTRIEPRYFDWPFFSRQRSHHSSI